MVCHLLAGCSILALKQYYQHNLEKVSENEETQLYWNRIIITDKEVVNKIIFLTVLTLKNKGITYSIEVTVPFASDKEEKNTQKINKYLPLADETGKCGICNMNFIIFVLFLLH